MKLTENQKLLVRGLRAFGLPEDEQIAIFLFCDTEEKQNQLMEFMASNVDATRDEIMDVVWTMLPKK